MGVSDGYRAEIGVELVLCDQEFKSVPVTVKAYENDTVLLPCYTDNTEGDIRVRWYKNGTLLADSRDPNLLLPLRTRMYANFSLQVDELIAKDTAEYTCEVIRPEPWGPIRQSHTIEVQYAPTVRTLPDDSFLEVKKGEYVDIGCETTGSPPPIVNWRKNGEPMALLEHRSRIRFRAEHRLLAGVYECTASNGVGDPVTASITVIIQGERFLTH
ncbi:jg27930 [Pararge aegeria aegeria]|uniref:Jg27930 protein n=1 Tax=Pararge aegeria aegeria TaxID=348720 RepID=A0A8S4R2N2_9NEOP|nr:jg27930 [Pararge aegeria aegeria]